MDSTALVNWYFFIFGFNSFLPIDINECLVSNGRCEQNCANIESSFSCSCGTGYNLDRNGFNCSGKEILIARASDRIVIVLQ